MSGQSIYKIKHSPLPPCFLSFVWSLLCTQFNVQFVFNVQYQKNSTFDRQHILKQRFKQGLCVFLLLLLLLFFV